MSLVDQIANRRAPAVVRNDHYSTCRLCGDRLTGSMYTCSHCPNISHLKCIQKDCNDIPQDGDKWICTNCVRKMDNVNHTNECAQCNEWNYLNEDINSMINSLEIVEEDISQDTRIEEEAVSNDLGSYHGVSVQSGSL